MNKNLRYASLSQNTGTATNEEEPQASTIAFEAAVKEALNNQLLSPSDETVEKIVAILRAHAPQRNS